MAIDPNISLGVKSPEGLDITKYAQLANLAQQNQNLQAEYATKMAALPGVEADSAIKKRAADFNNWLTQNRAKLVNQDGSPNVDAIINHASSAGYFNEAQSAAAHKFQTDAAQIKNSTDIQDRNLKTSKYTQDLLSTTATLLDAAGEKQRPELLQKYAQYADSLIPGSGKQITTIFGKPNKETGTIDVNQENVKAIKQATINALQQEQLGIQKGQLGISYGQLGISQQDLALRQAAQGKEFAAAGFTPEGQDPKSEVNQMFRETMRKSGVPVDDNMTIWKAQQIAGTKETATAAQTGQIVPAATRAGALANIGELEGYNKQLQTGINASSKLAKDKDYDTKIGQIGNALRSRFENDPEFAGMRTLVQVHNANPLFKDDQIDVTMMSPRQILRKLQADQALVQNKISGQSNVVGAQQFPSNSSPSSVAGMPTKVSKDEQAARDADRLAILRSELNKPGNSKEDIAAIQREIQRAGGKIEAPAETSTGKKAPPKKNEIITASDGSKYVFKGGDPKDKNNYVKVK
jgi:hypothetical protein